MRQLLDHGANINELNDDGVTPLSATVALLLDNRRTPQLTPPGITQPGITSPGITPSAITPPGITPPGITPTGMTTSSVPSQVREGSQTAVEPVKVLVSFLPHDAMLAPVLAVVV